MVTVLTGESGDSSEDITVEFGCGCSDRSIGKVVVVVLVVVVIVVISLIDGFEGSEWRVSGMRL